jgi:hypothetical protein
MPGSVVALNRVEEDRSNAGLDPIKSGLHPAQSGFDPIQAPDPLFGFVRNPESVETEERSVSTVPRIPQPTGSDVTTRQPTSVTGSDVITRQPISVSGSFSQFPVIFNFEDLEEKSSLAQIGSGPFDVRSESRLTSKEEKFEEEKSFKEENRSYNMKENISYMEENRSFKEENRSYMEGSRGFKEENKMENESIKVKSRSALTVEQFDEEEEEENRNNFVENLIDFDNKKDSERVLKDEKMLDDACVKDLNDFCVNDLNDFSVKDLDDVCVRDLYAQALKKVVDSEDRLIDVNEDESVVVENDEYLKESEGVVVDVGLADELDRDRIDRDFRAAFFGFGEDGRTFENIPDENPSDEDEEEEVREKEKKKSVIKVILPLCKRYLNKRLIVFNVITDFRFTKLIL